MCRDLRLITYHFSWPEQDIKLSVEGNKGTPKEEGDSFPGSGLAKAFLLLLHSSVRHMYMGTASGPLIYIFVQSEVSFGGLTAPCLLQPICPHVDSTHRRPQPPLQ